MIRHVVLFKFKTDVPQAECERYLEQVRALPDKIDFIRAFSVGTDQLHLPHSYDVAVVADFDSLDDVRAYAKHPAHVPVIEFGSTLTEHRAAVDFET